MIEEDENKILRKLQRLGGYHISKYCSDLNGFFSPNDKNKKNAKKIICLLIELKKFDHCPDQIDGLIKSFTEVYKNENKELIK